MPFFQQDGSTCHTTGDLKAVLSPVRFPSCRCVVVMCVFLPPCISSYPLFGLKIK